MFLVQRLAEEKIQAAIDRGDLEDLPGDGKPLNLDDNKFVPPELRAAYRILKNSGYLPQEQSVRTEIREVETLMHQIDSEEQEKKTRQRLSLLSAQLEKSGMSSSLFVQEEVYRQKILQKISK